MVVRDGAAPEQSLTGLEVGHGAPPVRIRGDRSADPLTITVVSLLLSPSRTAALPRAARMRIRPDVACGREPSIY
jgi:hypothetical protein